MTTDARINALRSSVIKLRDVASTIRDADLSDRAYPSEWSLADVLSHIGSGAVIMQRGLEDSLANRATPDNFAPGVWDSWNAKDPAAQRADALTADESLIARIESVTPEERDGFTFAMGPMTMDFGGFVGMRLNEHALHTWDIEIALDPAATIPESVVEFIVDNLEVIARFTGKPTGDTRGISISTTKPDRTFRIDLSPGSVVFGQATAVDAVDVQLPAEAFVHLVYGRLDADHAPGGLNGDLLDVLRIVFPGP